MNVETKAEKTIYEIQKLDTLLINEFSWRRRGLINFLREKNYLGNIKLDKALETAVFKRAQEDYSFLIRREKSIDFFAEELLHPEYLAYAIMKGKFSDRQIKKIPFDPYNIKGSFLDNYADECLILRIRDRFLNPQKPVGYIRRNEFTTREISQRC